MLLPLNKMKKKNIIWIIVFIIFLIIFIWGLIGAQEAGKLTNDCSFGLGKRLCWFWEQNRLGEIADIFKR